MAVHILNGTRVYIAASNYHASPSLALASSTFLFLKRGRRRASQFRYFLPFSLGRVPLVVCQKQPPPPSTCEHTHPCASGQVASRMAEAAAAESGTNTAGRTGFYWIQRRGGGQYRRSPPFKPGGGVGGGNPPPFLELWRGEMKLLPTLQVMQVFPPSLPVTSSISEECLPARKPWFNLTANLG